MVDTERECSGHDCVRSIHITVKLNIDKLLKVPIHK